MSTTVSFAGSNYKVPALGDSGWASGAGNLSSYLIAIAAGTLQTTGGSFTLSADANFGLTYGILAKYITSVSASPATAGVLRLASGDTIDWGVSNLALGISGTNLVWNGANVLAGNLSSDVTSVGLVTTVAYVGGSTAALVHSAELLANAATNANTASTIVERDSSGNFSAGTISATLSGNATTATTATNLASGSAGQVPYQTGSGATSFTGGSSGQVLASTGSGLTWTLATNANTASTIVERDSSGNFSAGTITAALTGVASEATKADGLTTATTTVVVSAATAPSNGQVLTALGSTSANWQTPNTFNVGNSLQSGLQITPSVGSVTNSVTVTAGTLSIQGVVQSGITSSASFLVSGAGGLDTGSVAATTWYAVHQITDNTGSKNNSVLSLSATSPTMPATYTKFRRIGWVNTNGSSQIVQFQMQKDWWYWIDGTQFAPSPATGTLNLQSYGVPPSSTLVVLAVRGGSAGYQTTATVTGTSMPATAIEGSYNLNITGAFPCSTSQQIDLATSGVNGMIVLGYYDPV